MDTGLIVIGIGVILFIVGTLGFIKSPWQSVPLDLLGVFVVLFGVVILVIEKLHVNTKVRAII